MRSAAVSVHGHLAGTLTEIARNRAYCFTYESDYQGPPVSVTLPVRSKPYEFDRFPCFFDGLLPEGARLEAGRRATKHSIQGVQPKLSAVLRPRERRFEIVDSGGTYILKPPHAEHPNVPENEDLTMRLAEAAGIEVPPHGLVRGRDGTWTCFIRRFDRLPRGHAPEELLCDHPRREDTARTGL